jgi:diaminopimelate decarboxylase
MTSRPHSHVLRAAVRDDALLVGGKTIAELAAIAGRTPFYAYDSAAVAARIAEVRTVLSESVELHYAIKANPHRDLVRFVAPLVDGLDVASAGELRIALSGPTSPRDISFAGPGKSDAELEEATTAGVLINVESFREIAFLATIRERSGRQARVAVRVNPDFELKSSGMKMGGGPKQFGIDAEEVPRALASIRVAGLAFEGFHIFAGSQNLHSAAICEALSKAYELALRLAADAPSPIRVLNLGGGFGIPYFPGDAALDTSPIRQTLADLANRARRDLPEAKLVVELGRYLVGEAGVYVCRVIDRKVSRGQTFLVTDGGLHHHLAASGNFGQVLRKNYPVVVAHRVQGGPREIASVVGPLCTPLDVLGDRIDVGVAQPGDLIAVLQSGAYGASASPAGFLSHPPAVELVV